MVKVNLIQYGLSQFRRNLKYEAGQETKPQNRTDCFLRSKFLLQNATELTN